MRSTSSSLKCQEACNGSGWHTNPLLSAVNKALTKEELAKHYRRRIRGTQATFDLVENLLLSLSTVTDSLRVFLLRTEIEDIGKGQKKQHCLFQNPPGVQLYTVTGNV